MVDRGDLRSTYANIFSTSKEVDAAADRACAADAIDPGGVVAARPDVTDGPTHGFNRRDRVALDVVGCRPAFL